MNGFELLRKLAVSAERLRDQADDITATDRESLKLKQTLNSTACLYDWHGARLEMEGELPSWAAYFESVEL